MLSLPSPFDAYRADLDRSPDKAEFGSSDTLWLLLAHCLQRVSSLADLARKEVAANCATALRDLADPEQGDEEHSGDLKLLIEGLTTLSTRAGASALTRAARGFADRMSESGALSMAFCVLGHTRNIAAEASDHERGLLAADQGRVARLLGNLESAEELYRVSALIGERSSNTELLARASVGRGVIARVRGNYPGARLLFQQGLMHAESGGHRSLEGMAHQGLTITAAVAGDFDAALIHGWSAFCHAAGERTREAESLTNLAQLCLEAGFNAAALRGFLSGISRTNALRVRLSALGGAALSAARLDDHGTLQLLATEIELSVERSALPYENAQALYHLSSAFARVGDEARCDLYRNRSREIAESRGFHELVHATERGLIIAAASTRTSRRTLSEPSLHVVESLEQFDVNESVSSLVLTRSG